MLLPRRELLRIGATLGAGTALGARLGGVAFADAPGPILVVVHLRGACDGLNLVSPANDPALIAARAPELRVAADGPDAGHGLSATNAAVDFRLHPAAPELAALYDDRRLAFVHASGLTDANRSHFVATDMIEHGVGRGAALAQVNTGWISRYLASQSGHTRAAAVSAGNALSGDFEGDHAALAVPNLDGGFATPGGAEAAGVLRKLYSATKTPVESVGAQTLAAIQDIDGRLARDANNKVIPYKPVDGTIYEKAGTFGVGLRTLAQLIKMDVGVSVAGVEIGGWDTHENQAGRFKNCVEQLSRGLGSFWTDLADYHDRLIVVGLTEFGRRLRSNRSGGTDHGRAGVMMVLGGPVAGGQVFGRWPGLEPQALEEGVDLAVTTDYRAVLSEILQAHGRREVPGAVFPDFRDKTRLGLFATA